jgi:phosphoribosyl-ATP pyrophosphohydrolase
MLEQLYATLQQRKQSMPAGSYTASLLSQGQRHIARKVGEEALEVVLAATTEDDERLTEEIADLFYHVLVLMLASDIGFDRLAKELARRQVVR